MVSESTFSNVNASNVLHEYLGDENSLFTGLRGNAKTGPKHEVHYSQLLAPVPNGLPPLILGIGLNYVAHSVETKSAISANREGSYPIVFGKSPRSVIGPSKAIEIPHTCSRDETDFEAELAIVIGKECKNATKANALDFVLGLTCANDVSARKWQGKHRGGGQWSKAKSFDTFCPLGPGIFLPNQNDLPTFSVRSQIKKQGNDQFVEMQNGLTSDMVYDVRTLVEFLSQDTTLPAWTVILTGTPAGVGYTRKPDPVLLCKGDEIECTIKEIGTLWNPVVDAASRS